MSEMHFKGIPVRTLGAGSQPAEADGQTLSYIDMPKGMSTYRAPELPEPGELAGRQGIRAAMEWLENALAAHPHAPGGSLADLTSLDAVSRDVLNQVLGEGEVSISLTGRTHARTQESILTGVWRTLWLDADGRTVLDTLEVAEIPRFVRAEAAELEPLERTDIDAVESMNARSLLVELKSHCDRFRPGSPPHVVNLSLLPLFPDDIESLERCLGRGPVEILSRAYGKCQVVSTRVRNLWWVRYFNSMNTLILNTLEVASVPRVVCAAPEDLADSAGRLVEILAPYRAELS